MKIKQNNLIILILGLTPFIFWLYKYINVDLWYDEVYSLGNFVLGDFNQTLFYYPLPNNHVFFNFINQIISRITNYRDIIKVAEHVYVFRLFQGLITLLIAYYSVLIIKRFFKLKDSVLLFTILFTTIPFMNFSLQLRGYNMSSLFLIMTMYYTWSFIENSNKRNRNFIIISSALLIYTIPSNIYMLVSVMVPLFVLWLYHRKQNRTESSIYYKTIFFISIGIGIAITLYLPVLKNIIFNSFASRETDNIFYSLELVPQLLTAFLSKRYLLIFLFIPGLWYYIRKGEKKEKLLFTSLLFLLFFPFILSFLHQKIPFQRVFIPLAPIFCILCAIPIIQLIQKISKPLTVLFCMIILSMYCIGTFIGEMKQNNSEIEIKLVDHGIMAQDIYQNYYLSDFFNQNKTMGYLKSISENELIFIFDQLDHPSTNLYLSTNELKYIHTNSITEIESAILKVGKVFIVTSYKTNTLNKLEELNTIRATVLTDKYSFSNIISVSKK